MVAVSREVGPFGQVLPHETVGVLVGAALPGAGAWVSRSVTQFLGVSPAGKPRHPAVISLPVLFGPYKGKAVAYTPNVVNSIVSGGTVIFGDPRGPAADVQSVHTDDILAYYSRSAYGLAGYSNPVMVDKRTYDNKLGGLHCGTNFLRTIPTDKWWFQ